MVNLTRCSMNVQLILFLEVNSVIDMIFTIGVGAVVGWAVGFIFAKIYIIIRDKEDK